MNAERSLPLVIGALVVITGTQPASAAESFYTPLELESCLFSEPEPDDPLSSGNWICTGHEGMPVYLFESDLRFFVSYGANGASELAAQQTLPPFNTINSTLEWRIGDDGAAYATILRFFADTGDGGAETEVLVVTRLGPEGGVCHIAYVNASENPGANELARQAADLLAPNFTCEYHAPIWIGERGIL